ncbi:MAG TPA: hypothetical protein VGV40_13100 [Solirubrobacteraceae bacterium]|nr:hypothetical protein [Solirubrobacteraceae bacterium]
MAVAVLALSQLEDTPSFGANPVPFVIMMLAGFLIGTAGHLVRSRSLVVLGIGLIALGAFLLPLAANLTQR